MTLVNSEKCETCSSSRGAWNSETERVQFYCERGLMGVQPCKSYSREPGSDDDE